jgi:UDP-2-acetamido-2,6-beta-L-arabino-hexul-4-ose reductase
LKILISGHNGFIGRHLLRKLKFHNSNVEINFLDKNDFKSSLSLKKKISTNDIIFHFASVNRHNNQQLVYIKNIEINNLLHSALEEISFKGKLIFTSSTQEILKTHYGKAKKESRIKFEKQSKRLNYKFYGIIAPNIFGPFCKPNYNSFIATFSDQLIKNKLPEIKEDNEVELLYVSDFVDSCINLIEKNKDKTFTLKYTKRIKVSKVLSMLTNYNNLYLKNDQIPSINSYFDLCLFNTFRSYINLKKRYPIKYLNHIDERGSFIETSKFFSQGQSSVSTTRKEVVRGNHLHTRKIERFSVIKGKASIKLRETLSDIVYKFTLDGNEPSYIDIPIWYTHSIENIGDEDLITIFWINEHYNEADSDTFLEKV